MSLAKSWFDHAFDSRAKTEQLLRPDLESGLLSYHDFDLAVAFLPGNHRYLPFLHAVGWTAAAGALVYRFKQRVRFPITVVSVSAVTGYGFGLWHYFRRHRRFARQLEDGQAFLLVLNNVNKRIGNRGDLFPRLDSNKIMESVMKRRELNGEVFIPSAELIGEASDSWTDGVAPSTSPSPIASSTKGTEEPSYHPKSTWEAIREVNAQNAGKRSSWDELRQSHERQRVSDKVPVQEKSPAELEDPRAKAQAEFDAILEAERRAARG